MIVRIALVVCGLLLILTVKFTERPLESLLSLFGNALSGGESSSYQDAGAEEDLLDNKKKWRLLITGYVIFAIYLLVSIGAIFTLNRKINTLYGSITSMEKSIEDMHKELDSKGSNARN